MAWTPPVACFFLLVGLLLCSMTVWEIRSPTVPRKGLLPMTTTRGDRLFVGLLLAAFLNLAVAGFTELSQWVGAALGLAGIVAVMRWG
jgi:predicted small integral membrane protein